MTTSNLCDSLSIAASWTRRTDHQIEHGAGAKEDQGLAGVMRGGPFFHGSPDTGLGVYLKAAKESSGCRFRLERKKRRESIKSATDDVTWKSLIQ